ncbi:hypothetical protein CEY16_11255 [Halalkalibacillus sediminis]|uniref:Uncharacterized protein n=1 Tax=Halalkalibacillus sediminis TaxID=2018042 RepID=A0A2I0QSM3_9BACI|nr:hypothetical protein [Halalkalibacillus sediminis]PKR77304.1 hypothetical protein CEY16_11255 [Halalkalibacillus sediminis]
MDNWKKAAWIAKFELKKSLLGIVLLLVILAILPFLVHNSFEDYMQNNYMGFDGFFIIIFGFLAIWCKPKHFQYQKIEGDLWASPYFVMLHQLSIPKDVLVKSRFIVFFTYSIPFHILLLVVIYAFVPYVQSLFSIWEFVSFAIIWIGVGIVIGAIYPASDSGDYVTMQKMIVYFIAGVMGYFLVSFALYYFSDYGIVYWTAEWAANYPLISIIISVLISTLSIQYWIHYTKKNMNKIDYLI